MVGVQLAAGRPAGPGRSVAINLYIAVGTAYMVCGRRQEQQLLAILVERTLDRSIDIPRVTL